MHGIGLAFHLLELRALVHAVLRKVLHVTARQALLFQGAGQLSSSSPFRCGPLNQPLITIGPAVFGSEAPIGKPCSPSGSAANSTIAFVIASSVSLPALALSSRGGHGPSNAHIEPLAHLQRGSQSNKLGPVDAATCDTALEPAYRLKAMSFFRCWSTRRLSSCSTKGLRSKTSKIFCTPSDLFTSMYSSGI